MADCRPFYFCRLPREIRDLIYGHLVIKKLAPYAVKELDKALRKRDLVVSGEYHTDKVDRIYKELELNPTKKWHARHGLFTSIMATSHQIYDEASAVLYGRNCFCWTIYRNTHRTTLQDGGSNNLHLPARYNRLITRIHFEVYSLGDDPKPYPKYSYFAITSTRDDLRRCCVPLVANRLRDVKVSYIDFFCGESPGERIDSSIATFGSIAANRLRYLKFRVAPEILEPLKLLKGVENVTLKFAGFVLPDYSRELKEAMTAPKDGTLVAEERGPSSDVDDEEDEKEGEEKVEILQPSITARKAGRMEGKEGGKD